MPVHPQPAFAIIPRPSSITPGAGTFALTPETVIIANAQTRAVGAMLAEALAPALGFSLPVLPEAPADTGTLVLSIDPTLAHRGLDTWPFHTRLRWPKWPGPPRSSATSPIFFSAWAPRKRAWPTGKSSCDLLVKQPSPKRYNSKRYHNRGCVREATTAIDC